MTRVSFDSRGREINHADILRLNDKMVEGYNDWIESAPDSWKADGFFTGRRPAAICIRYGQNHGMSLTSTSINREARAWQSQRRIQDAKFINIAIATDLRYAFIQYLLPYSISDNVNNCISCQTVEEYEDIPVQQIIDNHQGQLFDSDDPAHRSGIDDLAIYPVVDEAGFEIPIYNRNGIRVPRRSITIDLDGPIHPILMKLDNIYQMFDENGPRHDFEMSDDEEDNYRPASSHHTAYPQAFLRKYGHVQADCAPASLTRYIQRIIDSVHVRNLPEDHPDYDDDPDVLEATAIVVRAFQAYNSALHRTRTRQQSHDAQRGQISAALAALFADILGTADGQRYVRL